MEKAEALVLGHLEGLEAGETLTPEALCERHPELRPEILEVLATCEWVAAGLENPLPGRRPVATVESLADLRNLAGSHGTWTRYEPAREIGHGGMGTVLEARDRPLRRLVAMKVIGRPTSAGTPAQSVDADRLARFLHEARLTGGLEHPGIVPVHDVGLDNGGHPYFTMKLVQGRDLGVVLREYRTNGGGWSLTRLIGILQRVCETMAFAHSRGVVHRDLKPANVMVGDYGEVYVMDWGIARELRSPGSDRGVAPDAAKTTGGAADPLRGLTLTGDVLGTPAYMAPEQARGESVGPAADVYSLGAMLYELLSGRAPYLDLPEARTPLAVHRLVASQGPSPIHEEAGPPELLAICRRAMERAPGDRYPDVEALAADLQAWLEGRVVAAYERGPWAELRKWVQRNRRLAAAILIAGLALVGGLVGINRVQARANRELAAANQTLDERNAELDRTVAALAASNVELDAARRRAEAESTTRARVIELMQGMFQQAAPQLHGGRPPSINELLVAGQEVLDDGTIDLPEVRARLGLFLSEALYDLRDYDAASRVAARTTELFARAGLGETEEGLTMQVRGLKMLATRDGLETALDRSDALLDRVRTALPIDDDLRIEFERTRAHLLLDLHRTSEALVALEPWLARPIEDPLESLAIRIVHARALHAAGDSDAAAEELESVMVDASERFGDDDQFATDARRYLAEVRVAQGRIEPATELLTAVLDRDQRLHGEHSDDVANDLARLGIARRFGGDTNGALELLERAWAIHSELDGLRVQVLLNTATQLAMALQEAGAGPRLDELLGEIGPRIPAEDVGPEATTLRLLGWQRLDSPADLPDATEELSGHLQRFDDSGLPTTMQIAQCRELLARWLEAADRADEALDAQRRAIADWRDLPPAYAEGALMARERLAAMLLAASRPAEAAREFDRAAALHRERGRDGYAALNQVHAAEAAMQLEDFEAQYDAATAAVRTLVGIGKVPRGAVERAAELLLLAADRLDRRAVAERLLRDLRAGLSDGDPNAEALRKALKD